MKSDPGYSAEVIAKALPEGKAVYRERFEEAASELANELRSGDVLIVFSAGDATQVSQSVLMKLQELVEKEMD